MLMQGEWRDIEIVDSFANTSSDPMVKSMRARGYFRTQCLPELRQHQSKIQNMYLADFIYAPRDERILKNRYGSIENLYDDALKYMALKHHPNEHVRRAFAKVETMAALTTDTTG